MTGEQVRWTAEQVLELAPDAPSRKAGSTLAAPAKWSEAAQGGRAVWGLCQGSGRTPYRTVVDLGEGGAPGYHCSCPSRKFPCKHALALLLLWARGGPDTTVPDAPREPPEWAATWLDKRRERSQRPAPGGRRGAPVDPEAARKRAEQRAERITAGVHELDQRLTDLLHGGLASADRAGYAHWEEIAARMVDAQAPGLAGRVRELGALPARGSDWPSRLLAECALLHLLAQGYLRRAELPDELAATVRARIGLSTDSAALVAEHTEGGTLVHDRWQVLGTDLRQDDRLTERRVWLRGERTGRSALLLAFGAQHQAPDLALPTGLLLDAALAFYPGGAPLRAALDRTPPADATASSPAPLTTAGAGSEPPGVPVAEALAAYGRALRGDPWLTGWPVVLSGVVPIPDGTDAPAWQLADEEGTDAVPLCGSGAESGWTLAAVSGGAPITVFGECGPEGLTPHTVWSEGEAIAL